MASETSVNKKLMLQDIANAEIPQKLVRLCIAKVNDVMS